MERGFRSVHMEGVELKHMGQQSLGHYPIHFHMNGDVDEKGGYNPPTYVKDLSIHHTFSRCVTIHATNGLLVSFRCRGYVCLKTSIMSLCCKINRMESLVLDFDQMVCFIYHSVNFHTALT